MAAMFKRVPKGNTATVNHLPTNNSNRGGLRGRGGAFTRRPGRSRLTGVFADGYWHCDCNPCLPAEHFQVKKEGPNKGRWFYTCQNSEGRKCGFFLWDDDAKPREEAALLSNSRNEPRSTPGAYPRRQNNEPSPRLQQSPETMQSSLSSSSTLSQLPSSARKRSFSDAGLGLDDEHDSFPWPLTGQEAAELDKMDPPPETPHKAVKYNALATPATSVHRKLPWSNYSTVQASSVGEAKETPSKSTALPQLPTPSHSKLPAVAQKAVSTPQVTPSPSRFRNALADPHSPQLTLTADVFSVLNSSSVTLPTQLTSQLRDLLTRYELRTQGVIKGRDITRLALKARDAKIVELQAKITSLEAEREVDSARIRSLEWEKDMMQKGQDIEAEL